MTTKRKPRPTIRQRACEKLRIWAQKHGLEILLRPNSSDDQFRASFLPLVQRDDGGRWCEVHGYGKTPDAAVAELAKDAATANGVSVTYHTSGQRPQNLIHFED